MSTYVGSESRRVATALIAVGAMLIALATVLLVGQSPASANHASAPQGCFVVAGGANVTEADLSSPIVVNGVTVTFSNFTKSGQQVTQFDWSASGGTAQINFQQQGGDHVSSGTGGTGVGTGQGAINHFYICGTPDEVDPPFECPEGTVATVENPESIADCEEEEGPDPFECPEGTEATVENPESEADCEETAGPEPFECPAGTEATVDDPQSEDDCEETMLPDTGPGQLLAALMGGTGLVFMGGGTLALARDRRREDEVA